MDRYVSLKVIQDENINDNNRYKLIPKYPQINPLSTDIYVITSQGDRYDTLSLRFYKDQTLWWIISIANETLPKNGLFIKEGTQLRIPINISDILAQYTVLNNL